MIRDDREVRRSAAFQAGFEGVEPRVELLERSELELEMPESDAIKHVDDLLGHIGDRLGGWPPPDQETVRRRANSLWVSAGLRFRS